jgi:hypothetical protein
MKNYKSNSEFSFDIDKPNQLILFNMTFKIKQPKN